MAKLTIRRTKSKKQRALEAAQKVVKARLAWLAGKKATKVAAPAVAVGAAAAVAKKRSAAHHDAPSTIQPTEPRVPAGVA